MDAGDAMKWEGPQDERPLSDLGRKQAEAFAKDASRWPGIVALFASPALRAQQTLEPIAKQSGLTIETMPMIAERRPGESEVSMATRGERAVDTLLHRFGKGLIIVASHGDIVPAAVERIALRRKLRPGHLERRGQFYALNYGADLSVTIELGEVTGVPQ
jgi:broad specificity phosphatase PhoE